MIYDIFYVSDKKIDEQDWQQFRSRFPSAQKIENVKKYKDIKNRAFTKMFWIVWDDIVVADTWDFSYKVPKWDEGYVHVWKNDKSYDGISLIPKSLSITDKEFQHRFYINKKEFDVVASYPKKYDTLHYNTFDQYLQQISSKSKMVWLIPDEAEIVEDFDFDFYISHHNLYDQNMNHVFLHQFGDQQVYNAVILVPKNKLLSKREIDFRFPIEKKEHPILVSKARNIRYDIIFISYDEPNADDNYRELTKRFPWAKRIHGVKGIHNAHIEAAKLSETEMLYIVDGDAVIKENFNFDYLVSRHDRDTVHVWHSENPINGLKYGYGGVKLLPRNLTLNMRTDTKDMTLAISSKFKSIPQVSNITAFDTDPFNTWRSAFRECVKLASKIFDKDYDEESDDRLATWCNYGQEKKHGKYAIGGARAGKDYANQYLGNEEELKKINDFAWLKEKFKEWENEQHRQD